MDRILLNDKYANDSFIEGSEQKLQHRISKKLHKKKRREQEKRLQFTCVHGDGKKWHINCVINLSSGKTHKHTPASQRRRRKACNCEANVNL